MDDRLLRAAGGVEQVGEVGVQGGFAVAVALRGAQRQRGRGELEGTVQVAGGAAGMGEVVERGDPRARVGQGLGQGEASLQVPTGAVRVAEAAGEDPQDVVGLGEGLHVPGALGQRQRLPCLLQGLAGLLNMVLTVLRF